MMLRKRRSIRTPPFLDQRNNATTKDAGCSKRTLQTKDHIGLGLKIFAVLSIFLSIFGYFVAAGVAEAVGLDLGMLISGPTDLFYYETIGSSALLRDFKFDVASIFLSAITQSKLLLIAFFLVIFGLTLIDIRPKAMQDRKNQRREKLIKLIATYSSNTKPIIVLKLGFAAITTLAIQYFVIWFVETVFTVLLSVFLVCAVLGIHAGKKHVISNVFQAKECAAFPNNAIPPSRPSNTVRATCIKISGTGLNGKFSTEGILVASTGNYLLLYDNDAKKVRRIPITPQSIIESIDTLTHSKQRPR